MPVYLTKQRFAAKGAPVNSELSAMLDEAKMIVDHASAFGVAVTAVTIGEDGLELTTDKPLPEKQESHLGLARVIKG